MMKIKRKKLTYGPVERLTNLQQKNVVNKTLITRSVNNILLEYPSILQLLLFQA